LIGKYEKSDRTCWIIHNQRERDDHKEWERMTKLEKAGMMRVYNKYQAEMIGNKGEKWSFLKGRKEQGQRDGIKIKNEEG